MRTHLWTALLGTIVIAAVTAAHAIDLIEAAPSTTAPPAPSAGAGAAPSNERSELQPGQLEATFNDDSALKLKVLDEHVELVTPYGKLTIPVAHIRLIEVAARITDDEKNQIRLAVGNLSHAEYEKREDAAALLKEMGEKAYTALLEATKSEEPETARRSKVLLDELRQSVGEERLESSAHDVIETNESRIAGRITATTFKVSTAQFGELQLKLSDVREIRSGEAIEKEPNDVLPDPGNLSSYGGQVGKTFHFRVTGATQQTGSLYGTGTYTTDSQLAVAAVHCGFLKAGETKVVTVKIIGPHTGFVGSTQNGFSSSTYSSYTAYEIVMPKRRRR